MLSYYGYPYQTPRYYKAYATGFNVNLPPGIDMRRGEINVSRGGKNVQIKDGKVYLNGKLVSGSSSGTGSRSNAVCRNKICRNGACTESTSCRGVGKAMAKVKAKASGAGEAHNINGKAPAATGTEPEPAEDGTSTGTGTGDPIADFFAWIQSILDKIFGSLGL